MARASTPTLLSLDRFAQIMGINPCHFNGGATDTIMPTSGTCNDLWYQHSWQSADRVAREDLAREIAFAEQDLALALGYWPAPRFISNEMHRYPRDHRPDTYGDGLDVRGYYKGLFTKWGKIISPGQRAVSRIGSVNVVYSDEDSDSFDETATVSIATTLTNVCEIKVYFLNQNGDEIWEIRPARSAQISGGTYTATFWAWQMIDPTLWEQLPGVAPLSSIDVSDSGNLVTQVDVYREYVDITQESCQFFWEQAGISNILTCPNCGGAGCTACSLTVQDGCIHIRDVDQGVVVPFVANWDSDQDTWIQVSPAVCREPDQVKIWYYAGEIEERFLAGQVCDMLSQYWAEAICWMVIARLERPFCNCKNLQALQNDLREDMAFMGRKGSYQMTPALATNPFGTRKGEIRAWQRVSRLAHSLVNVAVL